MFFYSACGNLIKKNIIETFTEVPEGNTAVYTSNTDISVDRDRYYLEIEVKTKAGNKVKYQEGLDESYKEYQSSGVVVLFNLFRQSRISLTINSEIILETDDLECIIYAGGDSETEPIESMENLEHGDTYYGLSEKGENGKIHIIKGGGPSTFVDKISEKPNYGDINEVTIKWIENISYNTIINTDANMNIDIRQNENKIENIKCFNEGELKAYEEKIIEDYKKKNDNFISEEELKLIPESEEYDNLNKLINAGISKEIAINILKASTNDSHLEELLNMIDDKIETNTNKFNDLFYKKRTILEIILNLNPGHTRATMMLEEIS